MAGRLLPRRVVGCKWFNGRKCWSALASRLGNWQIRGISQRFYECPLRVIPSSPFTGTITFRVQRRRWWMNTTQGFTALETTGRTAVATTPAHDHWHDHSSRISTPAFNGSNVAPRGLPTHDKMTALISSTPSTRHGEFISINSPSRAGTYSLQVGPYL